MKRISKLFILCFILICAFSLTACNEKNGNAIERETTTSKKESVDAKFLSINAGKEALKDLHYMMFSWNIESRGDYILASNYDHPYILRYNIVNNSIDKIIELNDEQSGVYYSSSLSEDGEKCIAVISELSTQKKIQKILIDFKENSAIITNENEYKFDVDKDEMVKFNEEKNKFVFINSNGESKEIKCLNSFNGFLGSFVGSTVIDESRIAVILPTKDKQGKLGYYKFAIIDIEKDEFIQECAIN